MGHEGDLNAPLGIDVEEVGLQGAFSDVSDARRYVSASFRVAWTDKAAIERTSLRAPRVPQQVASGRLQQANQGALFEAPTTGSFASVLTRDCRLFGQRYRFDENFPNAKVFQTIYVAFPQDS